LETSLMILGTALELPLVCYHKSWQCVAVYWLGIYWKAMTVITCKY
jgi:hypothetical protein